MNELIDALFSVVHFSQGLHLGIVLHHALRWSEWDLNIGCRSRNVEFRMERYFTSLFDIQHSIFIIQNPSKRNDLIGHDGHKGILMIPVSDEMVKKLSKRYNIQENNPER